MLSYQAASRRFLHSSQGAPEHIIRSDPDCAPSASAYTSSISTASRHQLAAFARMLMSQPSHHHYRLSPSQQSSSLGVSEPPCQPVRPPSAAYHQPAKSLSSTMDDDNLPQIYSVRETTPPPPNILAAYRTLHGRCN